MFHTMEWRGEKVATEKHILSKFMNAFSVFTSLSRTNKNHKNHTENEKERSPTTAINDEKKEDRL